MTAIFIDSNIPMYLIGADHPLKHRSKVILDGLVADNARLITNVEVYQEISHRYCAIDRRQAIPVAFAVLDEIVDEILPVDREDLDIAKNLIMTHTAVSARDALHAAHIQRYKIRTILSFDKGFDQFHFLKRLS